MDRDDTGRITTKQIMEATGLGYGVVKMNIKRLVDKGMILRLEGRRGDSGYLRFCVPNIVKTTVNEMRLYNNKLNSFLKTSRNICGGLDNELDNELDNTFTGISPISSSKKITTTIQKGNKESSIFSDVDISPLEEIGFTTHQLKQLEDKNNNEVVQSSIYHFAYGLEHNKKKFAKYDDPLNVLMGVLRKGMAWTEKGYKSSEEIALEEMILAKRRSLDNVKILTEELKQVELETWESSLTDSERETFSGEKELNQKSMYKNKPGIKKKLMNSNLSKYFDENIWPDIKANKVNV